MWCAQSAAADRAPSPEVTKHLGRARVGMGFDSKRKRHETSGCDFEHLQRKAAAKEYDRRRKKLWQRLRGEQYGVKFRRQHPFDNFILDFVCLERKLVIEIDGGQHAENSKYDEYRTSKLDHAGFTVLRFWNNQVLEETDAVAEMIWNCLHSSESR